MCDWGDVIAEALGQGVVKSRSSDELVQAVEKRKRFYLGGPYEGIYLTSREAQCVHYYSLGFTLIDVAEKLKLSNRTVEYYIANVKKKLRVRSKRDLLEGIRQACFRLY